MGNLQKPFTISSTAPDAARDEGRDLWRDFQAGDQAAFESLYQNHIQLLIAYGRKITTDHNAIQDCIQDLFVELWESRQTIAYAQSARHYLLKALRYKIVRQIQLDQSETLEETHFPIEHDNAESQWLLSETSLRNSRRLNSAIGQLPKRQKEAIYLRYFEELSNEEVAQVMGVNYQSACKFIYTALKNLRERMQLSTLIPLLTAFLLFS
ncbi:RNA polymerase sigma factor [Persicitalea sp.]|uniref:RNA polymerase sigma factor n=1 Tax=Persicitalea sp. TaxID=3100273 RepID=UPI0035943CD9